LITSGLAVSSWGKLGQVWQALIVVFAVLWVTYLMLWWQISTPLDKRSRYPSKDQQDSTSAPAAG